MARGATKDLYLQINGDVRGLKAATAAGKTVLAEFSGTAVNVLEEVEKEMAKLGAAGLPNLKTVESAYTASFQRIKEQARAVIAAPTPQAAFQIIDAGAAQQAASNATAQANALRLVAEAASRADAATGGNDAATRAFAASAAVAAVNAEREAEALRDQAMVLSNVERQLGVTTGSQRKAVAISGEARAGYQQLSYQLGDVATQYASGTAASIIFAQQSTQVVQAISMISGKTTGLIGLLTGPWGIALTSAVVVANPWVTKLLEGNDALSEEIDKLRKSAEQTETTRRAKEAYRDTTAGVVEGINAQVEATKKLVAIQRTEAESANIASKNELERARDKQAALTEQLVAAREDLARRRRINSGSGEAADDGLIAAERKVATLETEVAAVNSAVQRGQQSVERSRLALAQERSRDAGDELKQIDKIYDAERDRLDARLQQSIQNNRVIGANTQALYDDIERRRERAHEAERKRQADLKKSSTSNRQFGREVTVSEATAIVAGIGGRVTSDVRSTKRQAQIYADKLAGKHKGPVAKPGTSAHEPGGAYDAIDVAYGKGISVASIKEAFAKEGVKLRKVLNEPSQRVFHVEFARSGASGERSAAQQERKREAEENRKTQNADAYASLEARARGEALQSLRSRATSISQIADLEVASVEQKRDDIIREAQKGADLEKWTQAQADAVKFSISISAALEKEDIREREKLALAQQKFEIEQADLDDKAALLRLQQDIATTAADRRAIARRLLEVEEEQVTEALKQRIAQAKDPAVKAQLQRRLAQVPAEYELKGQQLDRQTQDPLQAYGQQLIDEVGDLDTALKGVAANGFAALEDASARATASAITDFLKLRGVAGQVIGDIIADLARLAIKKAIVGLVGKSFFGLKDGGLVDGFATGGLPGYAGGGQPFVDRGLIRGPGTGRSDSILAMVGGRKPIMISNGEGIVNARAVQEYWPMIDAMNRGAFPKFADGGLVAPTSFVPRLPSIDAAQRALQPTAAAAGPIKIWLAVTKGEAFAAEVIAVSAPATVEIIKESLPTIAEHSAAHTMAKIGRPGI
ncbi:hypothetical protein [uncultured Sphingomonas sp.]|uniref:hypothetical protein n=1 Tax=uncultured Sphingomonas sp. TaxID=158754 RepID=UPI0025F0963D|nr:hypothetical protein [uncultured Sphingomonas sp.]